MQECGVLTGRGLAEFRRALLRWYAKPQRALPFRGARDAYRVWLSEVMLQQTRVAAAIPYYERFIARFPEVHSLARAREAGVLRLWAGLGYYSRARNLQRAAKEIVARHSGEFPRDYNAALALPGVGRYTAAAVLSIAYGAPHAALDGNVARVLARLGAIEGDLRQPERWRGLESEAQRVLDARAPGDWNQAMMELGATVCTPRAPRCDACPVAKFCRARAMGGQERIPEKRTKRATVDVTLAAAVLLDARGRTLLVKPAGGEVADLFSRMWQFPAVATNGKAAADIAAVVREFAGGMDAKGKGKNITQRSQRAQRTAENKKQVARVELNVEPLPAARHSVTHRKITLLPFLVRTDSLGRAFTPVLQSDHRAAGSARIVLLATLGNLAISNATRKIARRALAHLKDE